MFTIVIIGKLQPIVVWRNFDVVAAQVAITLLLTICLHINTLIIFGYLPPTEWILIFVTLPLSIFINDVTD